MSSRRVAGARGNGTPPGTFLQERLAGAKGIVIPAQAGNRITAGAGFIRDMAPKQ
jgi:hypothetical protein